MASDENRGMRVVDFLLLIVQRIAEISLAFMALVMVTDVIGRYLFNRPLNGSDEIIGALVLLVFFAAVPLATRTGDHVTIDLVTSALSEDAKRWQQAAGNLIAAGISLLLMAAAWMKASELARYGDVSLVMGIPLAPLYFFASAMLGFNVLVILAVTVLSFRSAKDA